MRPASVLALLLSVLMPVLLLGACNAPPPTAYAGGVAGQGTAIGRNASNEACTQQARTGSGDSTDIFCGTWAQPSASITRAGPGTQADLAAIAANSAWRAALDVRYVCAAPQPTTVLDAPALLMACNRRVGGWPQVALVTAIDGRIYEADGIQPALPVIPRAIGVLSGRIAADAAPSLPRSGAEALLASRLAAQSFSAGDIGQYEQLIQAGTNANLAESYAAAEEADRAALALQQKALGADAPDQANTIALLALQLSNQGRYAEADALFARAARFAPQAADPAVPARLLHYRALNAWNQHHDQDALGLLRQAEARYAALVPPEALASKLDSRGAYALAGTGTARVNNPIPDANTVVEPTQQSAIIGMIETRRYQAIVLRALGRQADSEAAIRSAAALALSQGMRQPVLTARLFRTAASSAAARGEVGDAVTGFGLSSNAFGQALPGTRPLAATELLRASRLEQDGRIAAAHRRLPPRRPSAARLEIRRAAGPRRSLPRHLRRRRCQCRRRWPADPGRDVRGVAAGPGQPHRPGDRPLRRPPRRDCKGPEGRRRHPPPPGRRRSPCRPDTAARRPCAARDRRHHRPTLRQRPRYRHCRRAHTARRRRRRVAGGFAEFRPVDSGSRPRIRRLRGATAGRGLRQHRARPKFRLGLRTP